ncbi:MAG: hypothetical protein PWP52_150 [Bacteroidales bacterium]|nr:hypothetical protein [Bacteroidales bacterium]
MQFDNKNKVLKLNMRRYIVLLLFTTIIVLLVFTRLLNNPVWVIDKTTAILITIVAYLIYIIITYIINYQYIFYSDEGDKIILKYVSLRPFNNKRNAIEIFKRNYSGYKICKSFLNLKEEIIFFVQTPNGVAKYPPISIAALTPKQKKILINSITQL